MEIDIDDVPWKDDLVPEPPRIENGHLVVPTSPAGAPTSTRCGEEASAEVIIHQF